MTASEPPGALDGHHGTADDGEQIFVDASGRRRKWLWRAALAVCVPLAGYLGLLATGVVSSSPLGTPPWVAEQPGPNDRGDQKNPTNGTKPSGSAKPGGSATTSRPPRTSSSPAAPTTSTSAAPTSSSAQASSVPPPAPGVPVASASTTRPGNGPTLPPGQSNRPTVANSNTNKGGH